MICIYDKACKDFTNNGLGALPNLTKCNSDLKMNSDYTLEFEHPLDSRGKWKNLIEGNILKVGGQLYRIYHKKKTLQGITGDARHISYDLLGNFVEDLQITNADGTNAMNQLLSHTQYPHSFSAVSDIGTLNSIYINRLNPIAAMLGDDGIVKAWHGELERDNFTFRLKQHIGQDRGVTIRQGKNLKGIEEEVNLDNVVTRIFPTGKDGLTLPAGEFVDSPLINNYSEPKIKTIEFDDIDNVDDLRAAAQKMFSEQNIDKPEINITVDFVNLRDTEEYKNYAILETCYFGDTVTVKTDIGIDVKSEVIRIQKNELTGKIDKIELGNFKDDIVDALVSLSDTIKQVNEARLGDKSDLQKAIDDATKQITSALGGHVLKRNGELLIMDTEDVNTATIVWRWNVNGLGFSGTGYNGPYKTAITADGHICADFITTGVFTASLIKTGIMQSKNGRIIIDLDGETINFGNKIILDANNNLSLDTNAVTSAVRSNAAYQGDLAGLQNQIDGQIMTWFYSDVPTLNNAPASGWTDDVAKIKHLGDLYYDTNNNYAYRFAYINSVYQWTLINDTDVTTALANAAKAQDTADHKKRVFTTTPVPPYDVGDLFSGGSSGDLLRCKIAKTAAQSYDVADWEPATKYTDDTALFDFTKGTYETDKASMQQQIDGKIETYFQATDPNTWASTERTKHNGDMWFKSDTKALYRYNGNSNTWEQVQDQKAIDAYNNASTAQDTADGKRTVFTAQPVIPYLVGDLWLTSTDAGQGDIYKCIVARSTGSYTESDWVKASKYTDDTAITNFINNTYNSYVEQTAQEIASKVATDDFNTYKSQTATQISEKVSSADMATEITENADSVKVAVGQIGGENLIKNSNFQFGSAGWTGWHGSVSLGNGYGYIQSGQPDSIGLITPLGISIEQGKKYTLSFEAASFYNTSQFDYMYLVSSSMGNSHLNGTLSIDASNENIFTKCSLTFVAPYTASDVGILIGRVVSLSSPTNGFKLRKVKLEEGDYATAWCHAANELKSSVTEINDDHLRTTFEDGSYSEMNRQGFAHHSGSTQHDYHYLITTGSVNIADAQTLTIQLPDEFKGKDFAVALAIANMTPNSGAYFAWMFGIYWTSIDTVNARFSLYCNASYLNANGNMLGGTMSVYYTVTA